MTFTLDQLVEKLSIIPCQIPLLDCNCIRSDDIYIFSKIGIPLEFAGWFNSATKIDEATQAIGLTYNKSGLPHKIERAYIIGQRMNVFYYVVDSANGNVVQFDCDGETNFVNSSVSYFFVFLNLLNQVTILFLILKIGLLFAVRWTLKLLLTPMVHGR